MLPKEIRTRIEAIKAGKAHPQPNNDIQRALDRLNSGKRYTVTSKGVKVDQS